MKTTWDCVYLGSYPQREVVAAKQQSGVYGREWDTDDSYIVDQGLYNALSNINGWDSKNEISLRGIKYRRMKKSDATSTSYDSAYKYDYYNWSDDSTYHYFKYEPIKWRVLNVEGDTAFLLSDKALDAQIYNTVPNGSWEFSEMRSWLNGYGSDVNLAGVDYSSNNFLDDAFSSAEQEAIQTVEIENPANYRWGNNPGENTIDKVFVLAESDVAYDEELVEYPDYDNKALRYGFFENWNDCISESRISQSSTFAKAMGVNAVNDTGLCDWPLRTVGVSEELIMYVDYDGCINRPGEYFNRGDFGCRPALYLDLNDKAVWSYAGTVCSDGTVSESSGIRPSPDPVENVIRANNISKNYSKSAQVFHLGASCDGGAKLSYTSDNPNIKVISVGKVTVKAKYVGKATITIKSAATSAYKEAVKKITITIKPSKTTLSYAKNIKGKKMKVTWKKNKVGNGYQIQYSTNSKFKSGNKTVTIKKNAIVSKTIAKLKKGKYYYVRLRTYKTVSGKNYYSGWSNVKKVKIAK